MADGEAECKLAEGHSGGKAFGNRGCPLFIAAEQVEREEFSREGVLARFLPGKRAAGEDPNGKDADAQLGQVASRLPRFVSKNSAGISRPELGLSRLYGVCTVSK